MQVRKTELRDRMVAAAVFQELGDIADRALAQSNTVERFVRDLVGGGFGDFVTRLKIMPLYHRALHDLLHLAMV